MTDPDFAVRQIDVERGQRLLITGLSFGLAAGGLALVVGPNGAGKSTLLRVLAGLAPAAAGQIEWRGTPVRRLLAEARGDILYRGHFDGLKKDLTVRENLEFCRALHAGPNTAGEVLAALGLDDVADRQLRFLSAGQRRRATLATLRVASAQLWLLDEPLTNLDSAGRDLVVEWIREHVGDGGLAVVATHRPAELAAAGNLMIEL